MVFVFCFFLCFFFSFFTHNLTINAEELKMSYLLNENNYSSRTHLKTDSFYRLYCEKNYRKYRENAIDRSTALWCLFVKNIYSLLSSHFIQNCIKVPPFSLFILAYYFGITKKSTSAGSSSETN